MNILQNAELPKLLLITFLVGLIMSCGSLPEIAKVGGNQSNERNNNTIIIPSPTSKSIEKNNLIDLTKIETVSYCELIKNSAIYDHKTVRVRAIYFTAFERTFLFDETCDTNQPPTAPEKVPAETWAEWDKSLVSTGDSDEAKLNRQLNGFGKKDVTVIGQFNATNEQNDPHVPNLFGHLNSCRFQFQIMRLEQIVMQTSSFDSRVKFVVNQTIEIGDFAIEFLGQKTDTDLTGREIRAFIFKVKKGSSEKQISWTSDAKVQSTSFEIGDDNYFLELENSRQFGKLAADEFVIRRPKS